MLERFTVGNFRSFDKNQTLSLIAKSIQNHKERLFQTNDFKVLKFASIFGANAVGKSNFIDALFFSRFVILNGLENSVAENSREKYFRLNPLNKDKPSYFEFEILLEKETYAYGFEIIINQKKITEEWLIKLSKDKDESIFTRNSITGQSFFNKDYIANDTSIRINTYIQDFKNVTNKLFLSELMQNKDELYKNNSKLNIIKNVYRWFDTLNISYLHITISGCNCFSQETINEMLKAIKTFSIDISNIKLNEITKESALDNVDSEFRKEIEDAIQYFSFENCSLKIESNGRLIFISLKDKEPFFTEILFEHLGIKDVEFSLKDESEGTQRLLDLLSILFTQKENSVFVIDEIDRSLHPQLTIHFVKTFLEFAAKKNIQLIIATHETHLLNLDILRQDEIFFIEASSSGQSIITPFSRFKERFDKKIEKAYLDGRYGAVPLLNAFYSPIKV